MVNHGMGYYERWFRRGYAMRWGRDAGSMEQIDKYRAQELAYGHAGFVGNPQTDNIIFVAREHHLMHPVQRLYGAARPVEIRYEVEGQWVTASAALVAGDTSRQRIRYDSGLTLWVNWRAEPWQIEGPSLAAMGISGRRDRRPAWPRPCTTGTWPTMPNARSTSLPTRGPISKRAGLRPRKDIEPRLASFKYLGGDRVRVTYEWIVNDTLDADYHCFVHGVNLGNGRPDGIVFQQDHALPQPTSQWRAGTRIVDGPYEFSVPRDVRPL